MKNIFKSLLVFPIGILCVYVVWALGYFLFTGAWLGVVSFDKGGVLFGFATIIVIVYMFAYLNDKTDYYS